MCRVWISFHRYGEDKDIVKALMVDWSTILKLILKRYAKYMQKEKGDEYLQEKLTV